MKKAFPFKKRLSAVLAAVLAVAAAAGTTPASAQDKTYAYSTIGSYGSFEEYMWYLCDNVKGDKVTFNTVDGVTGIPVVTKGANEAAADWASLATRNMMFAAGGKYQVSFAIKSTDVSGWFKLSGKKFSEDLATHSDIVYNSVSVDGAAAAEAYVGNEWKNVVAEFTVDGTKPVNQFRIYLRGNAGTQLTIKDFDVKAIEEKVKTRDVVSLYGWEGSYKDGTQYTDSYIEALADGYKDPGSIHFYQKNGDDNKVDRNIYYQLNGLTVGQTYTLKFAIKGDSLQISWAEPTNIELAFSNNSTWVGTGESVLKLTENYSEWQELSYDFTANHNSTQIRFNSSKYGRHDFLIDNIKVYAKDDASETNLIANGNFYATEPATTLNGWTGSYFGNSNLAYNNPDTDTCRITLVNDGADDAGAVYFHRENTEADGRPTARILYQIPNAILEKFAVGTEFVLEAKTKGKSPSPGNDSMKFSLEFSPYVWTDGSDVVYNYELNSSSWVTFTKEFKKNAAGDLFIIVRSGGYTAADFYLDNVKVYAKDDASRTNLIANGDFCEKEAVVSDSSAVDNSPYKVNNVPGFDIGMLNKDGASAAAVPGGSYDGSTALKVTVDGLEGYFQTYGNESETDFPDAVKRGKIAFVKGDTAVKASGYFKKLDTSDAGAEPKVWFGFGKEYTVNKFLVSKTISSIGSHYNSESDRLDTEKYEAMDNGWVKFEMSLTDDMLASSELKTSLAEAERIRFLCGLDCDGDDGKSNYHGEALFDDVKFEIISKYAPGDSNGDGDIDIRDLVHMKKYAAGTVKFTDMTRGTWLSDIGYSESPSITNEIVSMRKYLIGATAEYGK